MTNQPCHTELSQESKVSIKFKVCFKILWIFRYAQNDNMDFLLRIYTLQVAES